MNRDDNDYNVNNVVNKKVDKNHILLIYNLSLEPRSTYINTLTGYMKFPIMTIYAGVTQL